MWLLSCTQYYLTHRHCSSRKRLSEYNNIWSDSFMVTCQPPARMYGDTPMNQITYSNYCNWSAKASMGPTTCMLELLVHAYLLAF